MSSDKNKASSELSTSNPSDIERDEARQQPYLVEWDGDSDPLDPRTFSSARKWFCVAVVAVGSLLV
jgi:hypothetical protein